MINLENTTFIIPIKIEHPDRYRNAKTVLGFLNANVTTNVFIHESSDDGMSNLDFLSQFKNLKIKIWNIPSEPSFHRTKYLNVMLEEVTTPVVVNYDIDVILDPLNMLHCQNLIMGESDVIYPYEHGMGQIQVHENFEHSEFDKNGFDIDYINSSERKNLHAAECGHCIFFKTGIYRAFGGENEDFISYGPEDKERMHRFSKISTNVIWRPGEKVYHFEHFRGDDSWVTNPHFKSNWDVFNRILQMSDSQIISYYRETEYSKKYKNIGFKR